jgi:hypothetical protein
MAAPRSLCIIIPVHQSVLSREEKTSLLACFAHLQIHDSFLVYPEGLNIEKYKEIHPALKEKPVPAAWMSSIQNYNRMKVNPDFYRIFKDYDFIMTYELDSFIFSPDIESHFGFSFDFIGAPVYEGYRNPQNGASFIKALNSGFSIRSVGTSIKALHLLNKYRSVWKRQRFFLSNFRFLRKFAKQDLLKIVYHDHLTGYFSNQYFNEDMIFSQVIPSLFTFFTVAPPEIALKFSFEVNPDKLYILNHRQLPLGCHAWQIYYSFWKDHIKIVG